MDKKLKEEILTAPTEALFDLLKNYDVPGEVFDFVQKEIKKRMALQRFFYVAENPEMYDDEEYDDPVDELECLAGRLS